MKRLFAGLLLVLVASLIGYAAILGYSSMYEKSGENAAGSFFRLVEAERKNLGHYPEQMDLPQISLLGVFPGPKFKYVRAGSGCFIYYNLWPLGPRAVKDCGGGAWYYEE
jgi:hypothetical protein